MRSTFEFAPRPLDQLERPEPLPQGAIVFAGLLALAIFVATLLVLVTRSSYDIWGGLLIGPVLVAVSLPIMAREARREGDRRLFWFLLTALLIHLGLAWFGRIVAYDLYQGSADVVRYHHDGVQIAAQFRQGIFAVHMPGGLVGTHWPGVVAGVLYAITGPTTLGGFLFFAWLGFWGCFCFYRAFRLAVPEGRSRTYARLLFLLPALAFWSSFMGKDSWMVFGMGLSAYGAARILTGHVARGAVPFTIGTVCMLLVRPPIAGMVGVALAFAFLFTRPRRELGELAPIAKVISLVVVGLVAVLLVARTQSFLQDKGIDTDNGLTGVLTDTSEGAAYGGSQFTPAIVRGPQDLPLATFTVLFRPLPFEAGSSLERLASLEAMFLLALTIWRWRWLVHAIGSMRRQPYVMFCAVYVGLSIIAFSAFANFGLLDRERVQILPLYLVFLSVPPRAARHAYGSLERSA